LHLLSQTNNISSGTTLLFLPGNHSLVLSSALNLTSVSNVTLKGEADANIICTNEITMLCQHITHLKIEGLKFILNYTGQQLFGRVYAGLEIVDCDKVFISNVTFQGSGRLYRVNAISLKNSKSTITGCGFEGTVGGAIHALQNTEVTVHGCSFTRNRGVGNGGAIHAFNSVVHIHGNYGPNNIFNLNSDQFGGGAIQCSECTLEISGNNSFWNNSAAEGGALYVEDGQLIISGAVDISHGTARSYGGGIYLRDSVATFNGTVLVVGNSAEKGGGGMYIQSTSVITHTRGLRFVSNSAYGTGGAIHIDSTDSYTRGREGEKIFLSGDFVNNTCTGSLRHGGAVYAKLAQITFTNASVIGNPNTVDPR
jgi:predicted outer membrane repeat protein